MSTSTIKVISVLGVFCFDSIAWKNKIGWRKLLLAHIGYPYYSLLVKLPTQPAITT
jgi:hypothetical protein